MNKKLTCKYCLRTLEECRDKKYGNAHFDGVRNICGYGKWEGQEPPKKTYGNGDSEDEYHQRYLKYLNDKASQQTYLYGPINGNLKCDHPIYGCDEYQCETSGCNKNIMRKWNEFTSRRK